MFLAASSLASHFLQSIFSISIMHKADFLILFLGKIQASKVYIVRERNEHKINFGREQTCTSLNICHVEKTVDFLCFTLTPSATIDGFLKRISC